MSESKTPRTDEIAQRHLAGCDIVTCYHYAIRLANDLETELAASRAREDKLAKALEFIRDECEWETFPGEGGGGDQRIGPACTAALEAWRAAR